MNILVFAPHPDDDVLGCGGSIIKHIKYGHAVSTVFLTSGESGDSRIPKDKLANIREVEATNASSILGVRDISFLHLSDGFVSYNRESIIAISEIIRDKKPYIVYIPHKHDAHKDHQVTYELVMEAITKASSHAFQELSEEPWSVGTIFAYEVWTPLSKFSYVEDITSVMEIKLDAMKTHASQLANIAYDEAVKGLNRYRGALTQKGKYVECFEVIAVNTT